MASIQQSVFYRPDVLPALPNNNVKAKATNVAGIASSRLATAATDRYFWWFVAHQDSGFWLCKSA